MKKDGSKFTTCVSWLHSRWHHYLINQFRDQNKSRSKDNVRLEWQLFWPKNSHTDHVDRSQDDGSSENVAKKTVCVLSNFIPFIWTHSISQMWAISPGVEFLRILSRFKIENWKFIVVCSRPLWNVALGGHVSYSCSGHQGNVLKNERLSLRSKQNVLLRLSLSLSSCDCLSFLLQYSATKWN